MIEKLLIILLFFPSLAWGQINNYPLTGVIPGTGITMSGTNNITINSSSEQTITFAPGLLSTITNNIGGFTKIAKASTVDNLVATGLLFVCVGNPTITMYECGTSTVCNSPTTIGTVTLTAAGTVVTGSLSSTAIVAGDFVAFAITAGTCTSISLQASAQIHSN